MLTWRWRIWRRIASPTPRLLVCFQRWRWKKHIEFNDDDDDDDDDDGDDDDDDVGYMIYIH